MISKIRCPVCHGQPLVPVFIRYTDEATEEDKKKVPHFDCNLCNGEGMINPQQFLRYEAGRAHRQLRMSRGYGPREYAIKLGVLPSDICRMENGNIDRLDTIEFTHVPPSDEELNDRVELMKQ